MTKHAPDDQANPSPDCACYSRGRQLAPCSYALHVDRVLGYSRNYRLAEYRRARGLGVRRVTDDRRDLRLAGLCALLVWALCAWMFWNCNFAGV